jgi:superfamily II DNA or RNA helicase
MPHKITRYGYILDKNLLSEDQIFQIKKDLTVKPFKFSKTKYKSKRKDDSFPLYQETGDHIGVPRQYGLGKFGQPEIDKLKSYDYSTHNMKYVGKLRPVQKMIVFKVLKGLREHTGGLLIAGCGSGKTNMAIYIACKLKLKTLFIVHKTFLKNQITARIKTFTNKKRVGTIQGKIVDASPAFVVATVQSLALKEYDSSIFKEFGLIIMDEVHHMAARCFSKTFLKYGAKYMLGITAERNRDDGLYKVLNMFIGPILHFEDQKPNDKVVVRTYWYKSIDVKHCEPIINRYTQDVDRSTMITNVTKIKSRNKFIFQLILKLFDQGKNVLYLSNRLKQIAKLYKALEANEYLEGNVGLYLGGMSESELAESGTKQIILGTFSMAEEGLDIENLNVIILGTPKSKIRQSVGRILRKEVYEEHPIVIDIRDDIEVFGKQYEKRLAYYCRQKYAIYEYYVTDDVNNVDEKFKQFDDEQFIVDSLNDFAKDNLLDYDHYDPTDRTLNMFDE